MLIHVHPTEEAPGAERLNFGFRPASLRRKIGLAGRRFVEGGAGPAADLPVHRMAPGHRGFAHLDRSRGDRFVFWRPGAELAIVLGPLNSMVRDSAVSLQVRAAEIGAVSFSHLTLGRLRLLYVPPEALAYRDFREALTRAMGEASPGLLLVDEAHAVSEWSAGFRPAYRRIPQLIEDLARKSPDLSVLALTAARDPATRRDAARRLALTDQTPPLRTDLHRPLASIQVETVERPEDRAPARERLLREDVPALFAREGRPVPEPIPSEPIPSGPAREGAAAGAGPTANRDRFTVTTRSEGASEGPARVDIQLGMGGGPEDWLWRILAGEAAADRVHWVRLVDPPTPACEADLLERGDRIPRCRDEICAFGRDALCDYGREHHRIRAEAPDPAEAALETLDVLDDLMAGAEAGESPIRISAGEMGAAAAETALHRLADLGLLAGLFRDPAAPERGPGSGTGENGFQVYGFAPPENPASVWNGLLRHLRDHDRSWTGRYRSMDSEALAEAETRRWAAETPEAADWRDRLRRAVRAGRFGHYDSHRDLFDALATALPRRVVHVADFRRRQAYRRLWNLHVRLGRRECRYAGLLWGIQATDEAWRCEACDRCAPDLRFDLLRRSPPPGVPDLPNLETEFMDWLARPDIPFEAAGADQRIQAFGGAFENIAARAARKLAEEPRNLKALYLAREFAREAERPMAERDLLRVARRDLPPLQIIRLCETAPAPAPVRRIRFELLDDERGALATPDGERWLLNEASSLSLDPDRFSLLAGRVALNTLARVDLAPHLDRLDRLLKEFSHDPPVQP